MKKVVLTTGDVDGIGFEVTSKAISSIGPKKNIQFIYFRNLRSEKKYLPLVARSFRIIRVATLSEALLYPAKKNDILEVFNKISPPKNFESSVKEALKGSLDAIVTAPLSKDSILRAGLSDHGHTDILRRLCKKKEIFMAFYGDLFSLLLATDHIPLSEVPSKVTMTHLKNVIQAARSYLNLFQKKNSKIGLLGLNPHAGEVSGMGDEERRIILPLLRAVKKKGVNIEGPLVPDVAFQYPNYKKYSVFICHYHDQGLIPFKILHKSRRGAQISLNLPFVRTSVDHGTAKDIFGKNKADPSSMIRAIQLALKLV